MNTILVPLDGSPFGEQVLPAALALARRSGAALVLAHVHQRAIAVSTAPGELLSDPSIDGLRREEEEDYLDRLVLRLGPSGVRVRAAVLEAPVIGALLDYAQLIRADLLALSTHGRGGFARAWLGSVTDQLIRHAPLPVLTVRAWAAAPDLARPASLRHILIPLDGSREAERSIALALRLGPPDGTRYTLLQVIEPVVRGLSPHLDTAALEERWAEAQGYLRALAAPLRAEGLVVDVQAPVGDPAQAIIKYATDKQADLIAMTTRGRSGITRMLLGSVAEKLVRAAGVPLLIDHPSGVELPAEEEDALAGSDEV